MFRFLVRVAACFTLLGGGNVLYYFPTPALIAAAKTTPDQRRIEPPCASGTLDPSFSGDGIVTTPFASGSGAASVGIQSDGRIVTAGSACVEAPGNCGFLQARYNFALARYHANGDLDSSFGTDGRVLTAITNIDVANAMAIQQDGRIVVAGSTSLDYSKHDFALVRYNTDGTLDTGFGTGGKVATSFGNANYDEAFSVAIQPDGKIVAAGITALNNIHNFGLARYNTDGTLDTSFGTGGKVTTQISNFHSEAYSVAVQPDGRIIAVGQAPNNGRDFALVRYNPSGTLDTSFGNNGIVTTSIGSRQEAAYSVAIQGDGRIVAAGYSDIGPFTNYDFALVRYNPNGTLDTSFGSGGKVTTELGGSDFSHSLAIQRNGRIVAVGRTDPTGIDQDAALARYNTDGTLDTSFNGTGTVTTPIGIGNNYHTSVAVQRDGGIVTAGRSSATGSHSDFTLVRYIGCSRFTPSVFDFDGDGRSDLSVFRPSVGEWYYQESGTNVTRGFGFGSSTDRPVPADFTGDGKTDIAFFQPATADWYVLRSEDSTYYAFPFGASGDIPAPADFDGDGEADPTVYRPAAQTWFILRSTGGVASVPFGLPNDVPVPADYDGDGLADVGIYRPDVGQWWNLRSGNGSVFAASFGSPTDKPVAGDYTGDGSADVAFFRPSEGSWYILRSEDQSFYAFPFGNSTDKPAPADFDGDGKYDAAVFRPSDTNWYIARSTGGVTIQQFGLPNDVPLPGAFVP